MQASAAVLGFGTRQSLRSSTAKAVGLPLRCVTLERISSSSNSSGGGGSSMSAADNAELASGRHQAGLEVELHVRLGAAQSAGDELMGKPQVPMELQPGLLGLSRCAFLCSRWNTRHIARTLCAT